MSDRRPESRYRRRVLGAGGLTAFVLYAVGAPMYNHRIEQDLERRVPAALAAAGFGAIDAKFSGQEGTLTCGAVLADPEGALRVAHDVRGVHSVRLDRGCRVNVLPGEGEAATDDAGTDDSGGTPADSDASGTSVANFATLGDAIAEDARFSSLALMISGSQLAAQLGQAADGPFTMFAPTDEAFDALPTPTAGQLDSDPELRDRVARGHVVEGALTPDALAALAGQSLTTLAGTELVVALDGDTVMVGSAAVPAVPIETPNGVVYAIDQVLLPDDLAAADGVPAAATLSGGTLTLTGAVADEAAAAALVFAATAAVGPDRLDNRLVIGTTGALDAAAATDLAALITILDAELVSGAAGYDGAGLYLSGAYANEAAAGRAEVGATELGATTDLAPRPNATAEQADVLEADLNEFVRANPITFQPNSAVFDDTAVAIIDRVAAGLVELGGLTIVVEGHTDSDGSAAVNQTLSEQRAAAVRQALVDRGVAAATITSQGFGSDVPVLVNGLEDKSASRRVEFQISAG